MAIKKIDLEAVYFLQKEKIPMGFSYPIAYKTFANDTQIAIQPWRIMSKFEIEGEGNIPDGLRERYPEHILVPFAKKDGTDDIACFNGKQIDGKSEILIVHDYASPGWELHWKIRGFDEWLQFAIEDHEEWMEGQ